nr:MAG TPA: hypothetical protein [Caudoviricetes sp.]
MDIDGLLSVTNRRKATRLEKLFRILGETIVFTGNGAWLSYKCFPACISCRSTFT